MDAAPAADAQPVAPSGYAYRYPDGLRFNGGREVNGSKPSEAIPYWLGAAPIAPPADAQQQKALIDGLMFDALGEPRTRYVRVSLDGSHCVMHPSEGDRYVTDARDAGDDARYEVRDVYLSEREFDDLPEFDGF